MSSTNRSRIGSVVALTLSAVIIGFAAWLFFNRQFAIDQISVWSYQPSSEIAQISEKTGMTNHGRFMFYSTKPEILESTRFNLECPRKERKNPILGCYTASDRIYIYNLVDEKLEGMKEVTAAHEMLHAVWDRTSDGDKERVSKLLEDAYKKIDDAELKSRMEYYQRTEPGEFTNELHSILGTEFANLGEDLEKYYNKYFDRADVLALHGAYDTFYSSLASQAEDLVNKMEALGALIDAKTSSYNQKVYQLSADISDFNNRANTGGFTNVADFNAERAVLVSRSSELEQERAAINTDIATHNKYYATYEKIASQLKTLNDNMDSYKALEEAPSV